MALPSTLMATSAAVIFLLGALHLFYTFTGNKFHPCDAELRTRLEQVSPVISRQTTMWKVWVGCNASHSYGLFLFGAVSGYLALLHSRFLFQSWFLLVPGLLFLVGFAVLGRRYWFRVPPEGRFANPRYVVSTFNELRPQLLAEATKNARVTAQQFAADAGARIGKIRSANQGMIQIFGLDGDDESGPFSPTRPLVKRIRVVSTFEFDLE